MVIKMNSFAFQSFDIVGPDSGFLYVVDPGQAATIAWEVIQNMYFMSGYYILGLSKDGL